MIPHTLEWDCTRNRHASDCWCRTVKVCKTHPKYKAMRKPTADCVKCRMLWQIAEENKLKAEKSK